MNMQNNEKLPEIAAEMFAELLKLYNGLVRIANGKNCPISINNAIINLTDNTKSVLDKANIKP